MLSPKTPRAPLQHYQLRLPERGYSAHIESVEGLGARYFSYDPEPHHLVRLHAATIPNTETNPSLQRPGKESGELLLLGPDGQVMLCWRLQQVRVFYQGHLPGLRPEDELLLMARIEPNHSAVPIPLENHLPCWPPKERNLWAQLTYRQRYKWRDLCIKNYRRGPDRPPGRFYELDGRYVFDPRSMYAAIGEAINGPGGYFGSDLDGLLDCCGGDFGASPPFTLIWYNPEIASQHLRGNSWWRCHLESALQHHQHEQLEHLLEHPHEENLLSRTVSLLEEHRVQVVFR